MTGFYFIILFVIAIKIVAYQKTCSWSEASVDFHASLHPDHQSVSSQWANTRLGAPPSIVSKADGLGGVEQEEGHPEENADSGTVEERNLVLSLFPFSCRQLLCMQPSSCGQDGVGTPTWIHCCANIVFVDQSLAFILMATTMKARKEGVGQVCVMAKCDWVHNTLEACRLLFSCLWARQKSWSVKRLLHVTILLAFC